MRVLSVLSVVLSLLCLSGVSAQYALTSASTFGAGGVGGTGGYIFNTSTVGNPTLTLEAGNTYYFDITAITTTSPQHPFIFSSASGSVTALDATVFNFTADTGCTTSSGGYIASASNTCILSLAINATAINQTTIYYKCTVHSNMVGQVIVSSNNTVAATTAAPTTAAPTTAAPTTAAPTTVAPTTASPTTAAPNNGSSNATTAAPSTAAPTTVAPTTAAPTTAAPTTGGTITSNTFTIVGNSGIDAYIFLSNGVQYLNPTLKVTAGMDVKFTIDASFANSRFHPFAFSNNASTFMLPNTFNTTDVFPVNQQTYTVNTASTCTTSYFGIQAVAATAAGSTCTITVPASVVTVQPTFYYRCVRHPLMIGAINIVAGPTTAPNSAFTVALSGLTIVFAMIVAMMA